MLWSLILVTEIQVTAINLWRYKNKTWSTKVGLSVYILMTKCNLCWQPSFSYWHYVGNPHVLSLPLYQSKTQHTANDTFW